MAREVNVMAYPFATQEGTIKVPDNVEDVKEYVKEHWEEIDFSDVDLDYAGADFDVSE